MIDAGLTDQQQKALAGELTIVGALLKVEGVRKHDTRFESEVALVAPAAALGPVTAAIEARLGAASKPAGQPTPPELANSTMCQAMGGLRGDQTLFHKTVDGPLTLYVAFWPWGSGTQFTIKIGVHVKPSAT